MIIDEDCVRRRAYRIWEAEGRPVGRDDEHWRRAHDDIERENSRATEHMGDMDHRLPLHVEEVLAVGLLPATGREVGHAAP